MLKFKQGRIVTQLETFNLLSYTDIDLYNRLSRDAGITIISEKDITVPGSPPNMDGEGGEGSKVIRVVKYCVSLEKLENTKRKVED